MSGVQPLKKNLACPFTRAVAMEALQILFTDALSRAAAETDLVKAGKLSASASSHEWQVLEEWSEILASVGQDEPATRHALKAARMAAELNHALDAARLFASAVQYSRPLVYDAAGRLLQDSVGRLAQPLQPDAGGNLRCAAEFFRAELLLSLHKQGATDEQAPVGEAVSLLKSLVENSHDGIRLNRCSEFRTHSLQLLADYAQADLSAAAAEKPRSAGHKSSVLGGTLISAHFSPQRQADAHSILSFVFQHLDQHSKAGFHLQAAGKILEDQLLASSHPTPAARSKVITLYRQAISADPKLERARYSLALQLLESGTAVEEGVQLLKQCARSKTDEIVKEKAQMALDTLTAAHAPRP
jgi:hypothetical protein